MPIEVSGQQLPARDSLVEAIYIAWRRLAEAGTWWSGRERVAIAEESRRARLCRYCQDRADAVSPHTMHGSHDRTDSAAELGVDAIEAVHFIATDASRITERWVRGVCDGRLGEERFVEIVAVVATVTALDTFDQALGRPLRPLPEAFAGEPTRQRPAGARRDLAWIATLAPEHVGPRDPNPYPVHGDKNIHRALSLVPQEVIHFFDLDVELYLKDHEIRDFTREFRAITHAQIELIAARTSALNRCFY